MENKHYPIVRKNNTKIDYFCIFGERCSGTNFLEQALLENFHLKIHNHQVNKHFFGQKELPKEDNILYIGIVRHPYTWINSFYKYPYFVNKNIRNNKYKFLNEEFWSQDGNNEITQDRNIFTKKRYKNIFELRNVKLEFLYNRMPLLAKNYVLIKYEDLRDDYENTLIFIKQQFNLLTKDEYPKKITTYYGRGKLVRDKFKIDTDYIYTKEEILLHPKFDKTYEQKLHYYLL